MNPEYFSILIFIKLIDLQQFKIKYWTMILFNSLKFSLESI